MSFADDDQAGEHNMEENGTKKHRGDIYRGGLLSRECELAGEGDLGG